jgi:hypothetical protein
MDKNNYPYLTKTLQNMKKGTKDEAKKKEIQGKIDSLKNSDIKYKVK